MQTYFVASPRISADDDSVRLAGAGAPTLEQAGETDPAKPAAFSGPIELRRVYRMSLFTAGTATVGTAGD
jgi:hypothetical protein